MSLRTLDYYFGKKSDDPVDAEVAGPSPKSPRRQFTINMVTGKRKKASWKTSKSSTSQKTGKIGGLFFFTRGAYR